MPLVTRQSNQGNLFVQSAEPATSNNGDLWVDSDTAQLSVNNDGTFERISSLLETLFYGGDSS